MWDGAVRSACEKACRRYHRAYELHMESTCSAAEARLLTIKSWLTFCTCILHSVHNAQRWSIKNFVDDTDTTRDNWITCESLINSKEVLWKYWEEWLLSCIKYADTGCKLDELWSHLGFSGEYLDLFVNFGLHFRGGHLFVATHVAELEGAHRQDQTFVCTCVSLPTVFDIKILWNFNDSSVLGGFLSARSGFSGELLFGSQQDLRSVFFERLLTFLGPGEAHVGNSCGFQLGC